ncbi:MAG: tyrosine-type recombinase/integrase, partial [Actinomycetota bacterium]
MLARQRDAYLAHVTVERGLSTNTIAAYRRDLARYIAFLSARGITDLAEVTRDDVAEFAQSLGEAPDGGVAMAPTSASRIVVSVRGWHRFAALEGWTPSDTSAAVRPRAIPKRLPHPISTHDVELILANAAIGDGPAPLRDRALLEFLYGTGARISEATGLDVDDLVLEPGAESVLLRGKGRKERVVPLGSYAAEALHAYLVRGRGALAASVGVN